MSKYRRAAKVDANQPEIVKQLRKLGVTVSPGHDDILCGYRGKTYWYELKVDEKSAVQQSQEKLIAEWKGHYKVVWSLEMILEDMGLTDPASP